MPNYDYECEQGHVFERRCSIATKEAEPAIPCETCGTPARYVILTCPAINNTEVMILDYPGSKRLKAGYVHSHGDMDATKISVGAAGSLRPSDRPYHPLVQMVKPDRIPS